MRRLEPEGRLADTSLAAKHGRTRRPFRRLEQVDERLELVFPADEVLTGDGHRSPSILRLPTRTA
jgi:hypothetical protein